MTTQEIIKMLISIRKDADRLHSGNVAHQRTHIIGDLQWLIDKLSKANGAEQGESNCNIPLVSDTVCPYCGYDDVVSSKTGKRCKNCNKGWQNGR